ncbi:unnamed protein product [Phaedon cochleariae]|uniref:Peptidase C1A papain C-terminal domain-containing protein n=1 Tax=Phaedon cochleariae TaxID=80249 RepID=A0A9P0GPJ8_PHACE|nr:unnamed protein product [Phaedon cochleariae]
MLILGAQKMPTFEGFGSELDILENVSSTPDSVDWIAKGAVLGVKNQGACGSCWAFSATGALEGQNAIKNKKLIGLSEQQLLDCSSSYGNGDCRRGGVMSFAFNYVKDHGIESEKDYPYKARKSQCRAVGSKSVLKIKGYKRVAKTENDLINAVATIGPISVSLDATYFHLYGGGIFDHKSCSTTAPNHGVLVVGYGSQGDKDFWLIKNSWGGSWGEKGYIRMVRNKGNHCGIANGAVYPVL